MLAHDVLATLGGGHEEFIRNEASMYREMVNSPDAGEFDLDGYICGVVEHVQQSFHDDFLDTTWPECPTHSRHPLWLHDGYWVCEQSLVRVARIGELQTGRYRDNRPRRGQ